MAGNLSETLTELKKKRRQQASFKAFCRFVVVNLVLLTVGFILDNLGGFSVYTRIGALLVWMAVNLVMFYRLTAALIRSHVTDRVAALELERHSGITDNSLVNAVCFSTDKDITEELRGLFSGHADNLCKEIHIDGVWHSKKCRKLFWLAIIIFAASLGYFVPFYRYAGNACIRYLNPWSQLASPNFTQFKVTPGDVIISSGGSVKITASAVRDGNRRNNLKVIVRGAGDAVLYQMKYDKGIDAFTLKNLSRSLSYAITDGTDRSREFNVTVKAAPALKSLALTVTPPSYTRKKPVKYPAGTREVKLLKSSNVSVVPAVPAGYKWSWLGMKSDANKPFNGDLTESRTLALNLHAKDGTVFKNVWSCKFTVVDDGPPKVRFLNRETNIEAGFGQRVPLCFAAEDDFGLSELRVVVNSQGREKVVKNFKYNAGSIDRTREAYSLKITPELFSSGSSGEVKVVAVDTRQPAGIGTTEIPVTIHIVDLVKKLQKNLPAGEVGKLYELLFKTVDDQRKTRQAVSSRVKYFNRWDGVRLLRAQKAIYSQLNRAETLAAGLSKKGLVKKTFAGAILFLKNKPGDALVNSSLALRRVQRDRKKLTLKLNEIITVQTDMIAKLQQLLGVMAVADENQKQQKELAKEESQEKEFYEKLKQTKSKLDEFMKQQRKIISQTESIDPKDAEDWSDAEEKLLGNLAAQELDMAKFFKSAFNDLSKLQNQDFSNSAMADEFVEMYEELQKAGEALVKKKIEIATLAENTALDSSNAVAANLERWLCDAKDYRKWISEENGESPDIPLTDLPEELTDIIGDLIETEEDMTEDIQDSTNSFSYSSDEALGWGTGDGTIDSMQAKGITGNVLPNNNEVGGRSGEGRSGKSSGQFVEKTATGKGGRKTPTRLVQSPYEKGTVEDTSKDAPGGATGGGKQSGVGDEGLVGVTPDQDQNIQERLAGQQGEMKQRAMALLKKLTDRNLPTGDVQEALRKMSKLQSLKANGGDGVQIRRVKSEMLAALQNARVAVDTAVRAEQEQVRQRRIKSYTVKYQRKEKVPAEYEDYVGHYFKALAEEE